MLDVVGQNYREKELVAAHEQKPTRKVIGTENRHDREVWLALRDHPFIAGQFLWPGIDYLGEEDWPRTTFVRGLLDRTGEPRAAGWERASWWSDTPMVRAFRRLAPPPRPEVDPGYDPQAPPPPPPAPILREDWTPDGRGRARRGRRGLLERGRGRAGPERTHASARLPRNADASPRIFRVAVRARHAEGGRARPRPRGRDARAAHGRPRRAASR